MVDFVKLLLDQNENTAGQYTPIDEIKADERAVGPYTGEQGQPVVSGGYTLAPVPKRKPDIAIMNAQEEEPVAEVKPAAPAAPSPAQNLKSAEQELQEAREADARSGSEGYEAKENGVFSRIRQFGDGIAYAGSLVEKTLRDIAQSPISNFIDPTTLLGGRQTMVQDLDKHFATRGIPGLKNDLLAQQKLNTELEKTPVGQFKTYEGWSPERQAAYRQFRADTKGSTGAQGGYKTLQAAALDFPNVLEAERGYPPTLDEVKQGFLDKYGVPYEDALRKPSGTGAGGIPTNPKALAIREGLQNYAANPEAYPGGWTQAVTESWNKLPASMRQTTYQPQDPEEKLEIARLLKGQELDVKSFDELATEVRSNAKNAAMNAEYGRSMHRVLDEAAENGIKVTGGGDLGKALRRFGANFGLVDSTTGQIISNAEVISNAIFGNQIAQVIENQNRGNITERERELFARQAVDLGASEEAMRLRLDLYILYNELALQASKKLNSLSTIADPIARKQAFESWQTAQYDKTAKLVRAIVDSHMGAGYFDNKEAAY